VATETAQSIPPPALDRAQRHARKLFLEGVARAYSPDHVPGSGYDDDHDEDEREDA
jgi:hypothetical protein